MINEIATTNDTLPEGYVAVPIRESDPASVLRLCVLASREPDPAVGVLVVLRQMLTGRALLGCIIDAGGSVHDWIELHVQSVDAWAQAGGGRPGTLTNAIVDRSWVARFHAAQELGDGQVLACGWEAVHPPPLFLHRTEMKTRALADERGHPLQLCTDDAVLLAKGLPAYSSTHHRYLWSPDAVDDAGFVPVTRAAPRGGNTVELADVGTDLDDLIPINPEGGYIQVRRYSPIGLEPFADLTGGRPWDGVYHGTSRLPLGAAMRGRSKASARGQLKHGSLLATARPANRLVEVLHLKLRLLADAFAAVHAYARDVSEPLLNLSPDSFQVRIAEGGSGLPFLWTSQLALVAPGEAVPLAVEGSDRDRFVPGGEHAASIYQPGSGRDRVGGRAVVRIREVLAEEDGTIVVGTLETSERLSVEGHDRLWMQLPLASGPASLFARLDQEETLAAAEVRFRTVPQRLSDERHAELAALAGVPVRSVRFSTVRQMSTPCDLYSLGVIAVRMLLTDSEQALPVAVDEILSFARRLSEAWDSEIKLADRVSRILREDERWSQSLGPHRLVWESISREEAFGLVPPELWFPALAMIVRMFPGLGPDSVCRDLAHAPHGGLHRIFEPVIEDLDRLLVRSRSLIVVDWAANREIHAIIRRFTTGLDDLLAGAR